MFASPAVFTPPSLCSSSSVSQIRVHNQKTRQSKKCFVSRCQFPKDETLILIFQSDVNH